MRNNCGGSILKDKVINGLHRVDLPTEEDDSGEEPEEDLDEE